MSSSLPPTEFSASKLPKRRPHHIRLHLETGMMTVTRVQEGTSYTLECIEHVKGVIKDEENERWLKIVTDSQVKEGKSKLVSAAISANRVWGSFKKGAAKATSKARGAVNRATSGSQGVRMFSHGIHSAFSGSLTNTNAGRSVASSMHCLTFEFETAMDRELCFTWLRLLRTAPDLLADYLAGRIVTGVMPSYVPVRIFVGTWNLGNKPPPDSLDAWVPVGERYDIYAIGTQESQYLPRAGFETCERDWITTLETHMGEEYVRVDYGSMWEIRLAVFVRAEHQGRISSLERSAEATGIGNAMGNKGGVGISFNFYETPLCFVTTHLAAHQARVANRNEDAKSVMDGIALAGKMGDLVSQFEHVFWSGDLNYRIDLSVADALSIIGQGDFGKLKEHDQLTIETEARRVFLGFVEGQLTFPPTYKYERGIYENGKRMYTSEKARVPSWCDRVLVHSLPGREARLLWYTSADEVTTSDHSPVGSAFTVLVRPPFIPSSPPVSGRVAIVVSELSLRDLRVQGKMLEAPPTVVTFSAPFLRGVNATRYMDPVVDADFDQFFACSTGETIAMQPFIDNADFLYLNPIIISLGWTRKKKRRDIAHCVLSLSHLEPGVPTVLSMPLAKNGLPQGTISFSVTLHHPAWAPCKQRLDALHTSALSNLPGRVHAPGPEQQLHHDDDAARPPSEPVADLIQWGDDDDVAAELPAPSRDDFPGHQPPPSFNPFLDPVQPPPQQQQQQQQQQQPARHQPPVAQDQSFNPFL